MTNPEGGVLLPGDQATVVYPMSFELSDLPELILKHSDGELIRVSPTAEDKRSGIVGRRDEYDVTWMESYYDMIEVALASAADMQAFGFRRDGEPASIRDTDYWNGGELIEVSPLNLGGVFADSVNHLPLVLHRRDHTFWRLREGDESEIEDMYQYIIETSSNYYNEEWREVEQVHSDESVGRALKRLAEAAGIEAVHEDISSRAIEEVLEQQVYWFDEQDLGMPDELQKRSGIQDKQVLFEDEVPEELDL